MNNKTSAQVIFSLVCMSFEMQQVMPPRWMLSVFKEPQLGGLAVGFNQFTCTKHRYVIKMFEA